MFNGMQTIITNLTAIQNIDRNKQYEYVLNEKNFCYT